MKKSYRTGIGIITCDRPQNYQILWESLKDYIQTNNFLDYIVVDDGAEKHPCPPIVYYRTEGKIGVAKTKNKALKYLLDAGCDHIFLLEDDIFIKDCSVFDKYIEIAKVFHLGHLNYAHHGDENRNYPGVLVKHPEGHCVALYPNVLGAFSYYSRDCLEKVGLMDENFYNAMEHVDHTNRIIAAGMHPPFRWFADLANSRDYIEDQTPNHENSVIRRNTTLFEQTFKKGLDLFIKKHGFSVVAGYGPPETIATEEEAIKFFKNKIYGK